MRHPLLVRFAVAAIGLLVVWFVVRPVAGWATEAVTHPVVGYGAALILAIMARIAVLLAGVAAACLYVAIGPPRRRSP